MFKPFWVELDDAVRAVKGHEGLDAQLRRLLHDPIHLVAFDQRLSQHNWRGVAQWLGLLVEDAALDRLRADLGDFHAIAGAAPVVQGEGCALVQAKALAKMMEEITGDADCGGGDGVGGDKKRRHSGAPGDGSLLEVGFHLIEEAVATFVHRHAAFFGEFREQFFLTGSQFGGDLNFDDE